MGNKRNKIRIFCSNQKVVSIDELKPNPLNPNTHPTAQVEKLTKIIRAHGWRHPITVSNRSGFIVSGHCRLYAAQRLGVKSVPVDYQDFKSEAEELAVLIADNKIQELAETDTSKMADIVHELEAADYDLTLAAVDFDELEPADLTYAEETLRPYSRTHVLLSFEPSLLMRIEPHLKAIMQIEGVEYEQASN